MTPSRRIGLASFALVASMLTLAAARHAVVGRAARSVPSACALLTATDAQLLGGFKATADSTNAPSGCIYKRTGAPVVDPDVVEITVRSYPDAATAHTAYPKWVKPLTRPSPIMSWVPVSGVGDEATFAHTSLTPPNAAIYFRSGATLVKIGVFPAPSDSALAVAARTVVSRM